jgi:hypothetical protein
MVFTGAFNYIQWAKESTFGTAAANIQGACALPFGFEQKISSLNFTNNKIPLSQLGDVRVKTYAYGQTQGSFSVDFVLASPWFFELIGFKDSGVTGCAAPYSHTWDIDCTSATEIPQSFTVQAGQESGATDIVRTLVGSIANSATISTSVGEVVRVSLDANYANETLTAALDACPASESVCNHIPFTFAHGTLELPNCTVIAEVQCVSITFSQNTEHLWGIGNSVAVNSFRRLFEITGTFKGTFTCTTQLVNLYEQQKDTIENTCPASTLTVEQPTLKLTFDNTLCGTSERTIVIALSGIAIDSHSINIEPNEPVFEDIPFQARNADITATNAIAVNPAGAS